MSNGIAVYARISFDWEGKALGVERQQQDAARLADQRGWTIAGTYVDNNLSAYKRGVFRPQFERMLTDLEAGRLDGVIVYDLDRLTRQPEQLERIVRIYEDRPGLLFATVQNDINLATSDGLTMARVMISFASKSSMDTSRRQKRKNLERAEQGKPHGSRRPFGYEPDLVTIRQSEAETLRELARRIVTGWSFKDCAYDLNQRGITTTTSRLWYPITVRNMLQKKRYAGIREHNGAEYRGTWDPIFTSDEWHQLQLVMQLKREIYSGRPEARRYLLTGLLFCGKCGAALNGETKRDRPGRPLRRTYQCRVQGDTKRAGGCGGVTRNADALDEFIRQLIVYRLDSDQLGRLLLRGRQGDGDELRRLLDDRQLKKSKLTELENDYADGTLDKETFARLHTRVKTSLTELNDRVAHAQREHLALDVSAGQTIADAWSSNSDGWRRTLIERLIAQITVNVGKTKPLFPMPDGTVARFDPSLIDVKWRY